MTDTCQYLAETEYGFLEVCDVEEDEHEYIPDGFEEHDFTTEHNDPLPYRLLGDGWYQ